MNFVRHIIAVTACTAGVSLPAGALQEMLQGGGVTLEQMVQTRTLGDFTISTDGRLVAYAVRGYYLQFPVVPRFGEDNNLHVVDLETGLITQITTGSRAKLSPVFSPTGRHVAYEADGDIWVVDLRTGESRPVTMTVFQARNSQPTWSPDGARLAFISNRGARSEVWSTGVEGDRHGATQLTNDAASESDPQWSPDGQLIAMTIKRPGEYYMATGIYVMPAAGGAPVRLTPPDSSDNFAPRWSPDGKQLAFLSDRNGYVRVSVMTREGRNVREFDTGRFDSMSPYWTVQPVWSPDGKRILISVNVQGQFQLKSIDVATGRVDVVGSEPGHYHEVGFRPDGSLVYAYENSWSPPDLYVRPPAAARARRLTHSSHVTFRPENAAEIKTVSFKASDGFEVPAFLLTPRNMPAGARLPGIVFMHPNSYGQSYRDNWNPFLHYLVQRGYVILMVNHRGGAGYGRAFRNALTNNWGTGTLEDVKAGAAFIKSQPFVASDRVGVFGLSMGGYHTLLALTKAPDVFQAGIDLMGITDMRSPFSPYRATAKQSDDPALYDRISPITTADRLRVPLLIIHADEDRNVVPQQTYHLADELNRLRKPFELRMYYGEAHGLADPAHQLDSYERMVAFFDQHLKK
jgi:dipeptidyl aminopeptidase/acylaminoacyl peptidase